MLTQQLRYTMHQLQKCAEREVSQRKYVYAGRVAIGKLTKQKADHEIAMMQQIAEHFAELAKGERLL